MTCHVDMSCREPAFVMHGHVDTSCHELACVVTYHVEDMCCHGSAHVMAPMLTCPDDDADSSGNAKVGCHVMAYRNNVAPMAACPLPMHYSDIQPLR